MYLELFLRHVDIFKKWWKNNATIYKRLKILNYINIINYIQFH